MNEHPKIDTADSRVAETLGLGSQSAPRRRPRLIVIGLAALALLALAIALFALGRAKPTLYELGKAEIGDVIVMVSATGTLKPVQQVDVGVEVSGTIRSVLVDFNDRVTKGQILAEIDTDQLRARRDQSLANLDQADARLADARATAKEARLRFDRTEELSRQGFASNQTLDNALAARERAEAAVKSAAAQVSLAKAAVSADETSLAKATIRSPIDGIVLSRLVEAGQTVAATFQTPILFSIAESLESMELLVDIDEADIGNVKAGQTASFTVDAYAGRRFPAEIISVRNAPRSTQNVVTYEAVLSVSNADLALKPGMTATVDIEVARATGVLTVPNGALRFVPDDPTADEPKEDAAPATGRVFTLDAKGGLVRVLVKTAISDGARTAVTGDALAPGTEVVLNTIREGARGSQSSVP